MLTKDFYFELPADLIAQRPSAVRGADRLLRLPRQGGAVSHHHLQDLCSLVAPGTLMVFNNSRVRRARVYGIKESTGRPQEFFFLTKHNDTGTEWNTMVKNAKKQKPGMRYLFPDGIIGTIEEQEKQSGTEFRTLRCSLPITEDWFERHGHIPLPPYIRRADTDDDSHRYQTIYATETGSAACPTAGLHFTEELLAELRTCGVDIQWITLHVGLGTFLPVRVAEIEHHTMHEETYTVSDRTADAINQAKREGRPILAVGTTSVRTLESSCSAEGMVCAGTRTTDIFIYPGYQFKIVDQLFTNFHTPESTLLMLVSAFAGRERVLAAYREAVRLRYRFFSYGDAMLIQ